MHTLCELTNFYQVVMQNVLSRSCDEATGDRSESESTNREPQNSKQKIKKEGKCRMIMHLQPNYVICNEFLEILLVQQFNGTAKKPRLSVFCSDKQLYATLVDDENNKCLFYGSTLQKSTRKDSSVSTAVSIEQKMQI